MSTIAKQKKHTKLLSREEENKLFSAYQEAKSKEEKNKLFAVIVEHNIGLVKKAASHPKYRSSYSMDTDDYISEGIFGLRKAADKFNVNSGYKFSTYAMHWVHQCMGRAKDNKDDIVRIPIYLKERRIKYMKGRGEAVREANDCTRDILNDFEDSFLEGNNFTDEQLANIKKGRLAVNFSELVTEDEDFYTDSKIDYLCGYIKGDDKKIDNSIDLEELYVILTRTLSERELRVLNYRYINNMTLEDIAQREGVTRECIRSTQERALDKARKRLKNWVV